MRFNVCDNCDSKTGLFYTAHSKILSVNSYLLLVCFTSFSIQSCFYTNNVLQKKIKLFYVKKNFELQDNYTFSLLNNPLEPKIYLQFSVF